MDQLRGTNALLTGAGGGLGRFIARSLAREGVDLALCDLPDAPLDDLVAELRALGVRAEPVAADLTDIDSLEDLVGQAEQAVGPLDILVNNAGVEFAKSFGEQTRDELRAVATINLLAVMELTRCALPGMQARRRGHVVNIASIAGKIAAPYLASYAATKHGVVGFTHSLRAELGADPVGFTAICPVFISRVGMYGRLESQLPEPPRELDAMPPEAVGEAVIDGIRRNRAEILVAHRMARAIALVYAAAPRAFTRAAHNPRMLRFAERYAEVRNRPPA